MTGSSAFHAASSSAAAVATIKTPPTVIYRAAIVGGSFGGLGAANALQRVRLPCGNKWKIDIFERASSTMERKGSGLGFVDVAAWESLVQRPMMRRQRRASRAQGSFYYGDLWKFLYESLTLSQDKSTAAASDSDDDDEDKRYNDITTTTTTTTVHFGTSITNIEGTPERPIVNGEPYDLVILADGGFSSLRNHVLDNNNNDNNNHKPRYAGYVVWRGSIPVADLPRHVLYQLQEGVYKNGHYDTIVLKMAKDDGHDLWTMGTFIATPERDLEQYWKNASAQDGRSRHDTTTTTTTNNNKNVPDWFLKHFEQQFDDVPGLIKLVEHMIQHTSGEVVAHPQFEFGAPLVSRGRILLLGDAAHMASPRTAVGAHTTILDALALREAFDKAAAFESTRTSSRDGDDDDNETNSKKQHWIDRAIRLYSPTGIQRAQALYARTREVSQQFVPDSS